MPIACSSAATACASRRRRKPSLLYRGNRLWRDHIRPAGAPPPRPTSFGTAGRLRSEQVADINRNARPTSSESALLCQIDVTLPRIFREVPGVTIRLMSDKELARLEVLRDLD